MNKDELFSPRNSNIPQGEPGMAERLLPLLALHLLCATVSRSHAMAAAYGAIGGSDTSREGPRGAGAGAELDSPTPVEDWCPRYHGVGGGRGGHEPDVYDPSGPIKVGGTWYVFADGGAAHWESVDLLRWRQVRLQQG
jgi:hypothetical protein